MFDSAQNPVAGRTTIAISSRLTAKPPRALVGAGTLRRNTKADSIHLLEKSSMKNLKRVSAVILAIAFVTVLGCAGTDKKESPGEYVTDSWITTKVKAALVNDP